jgi:hypothetical protein
MNFCKKENVKRLLFLATIVILLAVSCVTTSELNQIYDDSIPLEYSSRICTFNAGEIIGYNGAPVNWKQVQSKKKMIQIPAGKTLLEWNISSQNGPIYYHGKNILFQYDFKPMKQYHFLAQTPNGIPGFHIYESNFGEVFSWDNHIGHVPFLNTDSGIKLD